MTDFENLLSIQQKDRFQQRMANLMRERSYPLATRSHPSHYINRILLNNIDLKNDFYHLEV